MSLANRLGSQRGNGDTSEPAARSALGSPSGAELTAQHLAEATASRRLALLVTLTLHLETALTDAALSMFDKLMGSLSRRAERRSEEHAARSAGDLRTRLRLLAGGCRALIEARDGRK